MIYVSDIGKYAFCSRQLYLTEVLKIKGKKTASQEMDGLESLILRELAMRQAKIV